MAEIHSEHEILPHLPFKSLVRWMCASRFWYRKIRSIKFSKKYLHKSTNSNTNRYLLLSTAGCAPTEFFWLAFDETDREIGSERLVDQPLHHPEKHTKVVGHSNGLVCVCNHMIRGEMLDEYKDEVELAIWNPLIRRFKRVPTIPPFSDGKDVLKYPPLYGFGYNKKIDDYEVVQIRQCGERISASEARI